jgi:hypothetical protein
MNVYYVSIKKLLQQMFSGKALTDEYLTDCYNKIWDILHESGGNGDATTINLLANFSRKDTYNGDVIVRTVLYYNKEELDFRQVEILLNAIFLENLCKGSQFEFPRRAKSMYFMEDNKYTLCTVY